MPSVSKQTIWARTALTPGGWGRDVRVELDEAGLIASVAEGSEPAGTRCDILLPAASNLHSHGFQRAMAGLSESRTGSGGDSFWTWRETMYRFLAVLGPEDIEAITSMAQVEMLEAGYASVGEFHYLHHARDGSPHDNPAELSLRVMESSKRTGIGLTLLPVLYQRGGCDDRPLEDGQRRFYNTLDDYLRLIETLEGAEAAEDWRVGIAPHSLRAVEPEAVAALAKARPGAPHHIHVAEQKAEIEEVVTWLGARPVEWMLDNHDIDSSWCLIHCTHMHPHEIERLAASEAVAGLCPVTEANLGDGLFPAAEFLRDGGKFGIGTDSNVRISLAEELRLLEYGQRLAANSRAVLADPSRSTGRALYDAACFNGARAIGRNAGRIVAGCIADLVSLDGNEIDLAGRDDDRILDGLVFAGGDRAIRDLWSAGRHVVREGRHAEREKIEEDYRRVVKRLAEIA